MKNEFSQWFETYRKSDTYQKRCKAPVAYFCAEYAISDFLQTYSGGLGILAGDTIREASDQNFPLLAIGLYYRNGYFHHEIVEGNVVLHNQGHSSPEGVGLSNVTDENNEEIIVEVPIGRETVFVRAWKLLVGSVSIYLLDTDVEENTKENRHITDRLYVGNRETRFKQEMVLGIGGHRLLKKLNVIPSMHHINEGHSALLALDIAVSEMKEHNKDFQSCISSLREKMVFTNHTLIPAGNEIFDIRLVDNLLQGLATDSGVDSDDFIELGRTEDGNTFSMTTLALNTASKVNAVSKMHAREALELWPDNPMQAVTNGIHIPTWDCIKSDTDIELTHKINKEILLREIQSLSGTEWSKDHLLIGWAKRIVPYKRPLALFEDVERFVRLANDSKKPIRVLMAGQAHESDLESAEMLATLEELIRTKLNGTVLYLPKYRKELAKLMISGCDVWLNTPKVGLEACGTSGMKAALNGVITLATSDGWVDEVDIEGKGWIIENEDIGTSILDTLEKEILPMYYSHDRTDWISHMVSSRKMILDQFSATKMLKQYIQTMYDKDE